MVARRAHNPEVAGSSPVSATTRTSGEIQKFFFVIRVMSPASGRGGRIPGGERADRRLWREEGGEGVAAVEILRSEERAKNFGHRNRTQVRVLSPQP